MHNREVDHFVRIEARLRPRLDGFVEAQQFVAMLQAWIRGNLDWSLRSARYDTRGAAVLSRRPDTQAYRVVPPQPRRPPHGRAAYRRETA